MEKDLSGEKQWAEYEPSEGERPERAQQQHGNLDAVKASVNAPQSQDDAEQAPPEPQPGAATANREFVEDTAMDYDEEAERFARGRGTGSGDEDAS